MFFSTRNRRQGDTHDVRKGWVWKGVVAISFFHKRGLTRLFPRDARSSSSGSSRFLLVVRRERPAKLRKHDTNLERGSVMSLTLCRTAKSHFGDETVEFTSNSVPETGQFQKDLSSNLTNPPDDIRQIEYVCMYVCIYICIYIYVGVCAVPIVERISSKKPSNVRVILSPV